MLFFAAAAAMMLASCSEKMDFTQADLQNAANSPSNEVQFGTYMGRTATTRAEVTQSYTNGAIGNGDADKRGITDLTKAQFSVFAYSTGATNYTIASNTSIPNFMYNQKIYWDDAVSSGAWVYSPVKYWPNGIDADNASDPSKTALQKEEGKLSFFAYAPYMEEGTGTTLATNAPSGVTGINVKTPFQIDLGSGNVNNGIVALSSNASASNVWVKYVMPSALASNAVDLLWGLAGKASYDETDASDPSLTIGSVYNINLTKQKDGEKVKFLFKHALSKVGGATTADETESTSGDPDQCGFKVCVDIDANKATPSATGEDKQGDYFAENFDNAKTLVTLKSVKIQDGASAYGDDNTALTTSTTSNLNNEGWFNIETGEWGNGQVVSTGATYNVEANNTSTNDASTDDTYYSLNEAIKEIGAKKNGASGDGKELQSGNASWDKTANPKGVTTTPTPIFAKENVPGLLLIPGGTGNDIYVTVNYVVRTADPKLSAGYSEVEQTITNKVSLANLSPNKYYTIIMHLGLTSVKFEAVVADWSTKDDDTYNTNGTVTPSGDDETQAIWLPSNVVTAAVAP